MNKKEELREFLISQTSDQDGRELEFRFSLEALKALCELIEESKGVSNNNLFKRAIQIEGIRFESLEPFINELPTELPYVNVSFTRRAMERLVSELKEVKGEVGNEQVYD